MQAVKLWQQLVDLKARYLKEEANLRELMVFGHETSTQNVQVINSFSTAVSNSVAGISQGNLTAAATQEPGKMPQATVAPAGSEGHSLAAEVFMNFQGNGPQAHGL